MNDTPQHAGLRVKSSTERSPSRLPGEEGIWILVLGDMIVFALFFTVYLRYRVDETSLFDRSQSLLSVPIGLTNTVALLTSSWFVFMGVEAVRAGRTRLARFNLGVALLCGFCFVALKMVEYSAKFAAGITFVTNDFFMYYFVFTALHLIHVAIGLFVLGYLYRKSAVATSSDIRIFENGATFWHMVDLLWIMLFPLLYLVR